MSLAFSGGTEQLPSMGIAVCFKAFACPVEQDNTTGKWLIDQHTVPAFLRSNHNQIVWLGPWIKNRPAACDWIVAFKFFGFFCHFGQKLIAVAVNDPALPLQPLCVGCRIKQLGKGYGSHGSIASVANRLHYD